MNILSPKCKARFGQLSWETFVHDARKIKHKLDPTYTFQPPPLVATTTK